MFSLATPATKYLAARNALAFITQIQFHERKVYSQFGEDGVVEYIFDNIGVTDKFYVEFGTESCSECTTRHLWDAYKWDGVLVDGSGKTNDSRVIYNHFMTAENMPEILTNHSVPKVYDFMCVDIDMNEYHIARSVLAAGFSPNVLIMEVNRNFGPTESYTVQYNAPRVWPRTSYVGQSPLAAARLGRKYGYIPIYHDIPGINMFFIKMTRLQRYLKEKTGYEYTPAEIKLLVPPFETIYRRMPALHAYSLKHHRINFMKEEWEVVDENGDIVVAQ
ncbi:hypothetical protein HDU76_005198 [Blyttiomyces sp. JEL0837]|nr:hypothetical protein HDU76_005198 [Blyttiomyces sp. JEL0837]